MSKLWYRYPNESEKFHVINRMVSNKIQLVYLNLESLYLNLCGWHQRHSYARHHLTRYGHYAIGQNILNYFSMNSAIQEKFGYTVQVDCLS